MERLTRGEPIGAGMQKRVFVAAENPKKVIAESRDGKDLTQEQIKATYYLNKISHLLFPKNIPAVSQAFNDVNKSYLQMDRAQPDEAHVKANKYIAGIGEHGEFWETNQYLMENEKDPEIKQFVKTAKEKGIFMDIGSGQNFARDPEGNLLYLDISPAWEYIEGKIFYWFDDVLLKQTIEALPEADKSKALNYFERLLALKPKDYNVN